MSTYLKLYGLLPLLPWSPNESFLSSPTSRKPPPPFPENLLLEEEGLSEDESLPTSPAQAELHSAIAGKTQASLQWYKIKLHFSGVG